MLLVPQADCWSVLMRWILAGPRSAFLSPLIKILSSISGLKDNWQRTDEEKFFFHITKRRPLVSRAESRCVKRGSIWLRLQSSLFLPAQWPGTTQAAIYWWQLTYSTRRATFLLMCSLRTSGLQAHTHTYKYASQVLLLGLCTHTHAHTSSLVIHPRQIVLFPHKC